MKAYRKTVNRKSLYREYVKVLNGILRLTGNEAEVLALLLEIAADSKPVLGRNPDLLSAENRHAIMDATGINKHNLSTYLSVLKKHRVILVDNDGAYINKMFLPDFEKNEIEIMFILNIKENEDVLEKK